MSEQEHRTCDLDQPFLLPPSLQDWLPRESSPARFIAELVPGLDLSKIYGHYGRRDGRGKAAYHPVPAQRVAAKRFHRSAAVLRNLFQTARINGVSGQNAIVMRGTPDETGCWRGKLVGEPR